MPGDYWYSTPGNITYIHLLILSSKLVCYIRASTDYMGNDLLHGAVLIKGQFFFFFFITLIAPFKKWPSICSLV